jgi:hypothetical protein
MNKNIVPKIDYIKFFDNINSYTSFERKRILSDLTDGFDLNLLTEFSNSFVQYCFLKFNDINKSLPYIEPIEAEAGYIRLNEFHFPFYEFIKNEIYKEVRIEVFNNISLAQSIQFDKILDFLDEIETIIENQNIKIIGTTPEAVKNDEVKKEQQHTNIFKDNSFEIWQRMFDEFKITKSSRTDIDFMFQIMKYDNLIYCNIGLIDIQNWINETYQIAVEKVKYTDPNSKPNKKRMSTYNLINPK